MARILNLESVLVVTTKLTILLCYSVSRTFIGQLFMHLQSKPNQCTRLQGVTTFMEWYVGYTYIPVRRCAHTQTTQTEIVNVFQSPVNYIAILFILGIFLVSPFVSTAEAVTPSKKSYQSAKLQNPVPKFIQLEAVVKLHFEKLRGFQPKGIIIESEVSPLFAKLQKAGWTISRHDRNAILKRVLPDGSFLAKELRTPAGKKFAAEIYKYPDGYDRMDRLSRMPQGRSTVSRLIIGPDGYKMIKYMTTARGGKNLGKQLSHTPTGGKFNQSTKRIYTVKMLTKALEKLYNDSFKKPTAKPPKYPVRSRKSRPY